MKERKHATSVTKEIFNWSPLVTKIYNISYQAHILYRMGGWREGICMVWHCELLTLELTVKSVELHTQKNFIYLKKKKRKTVKLKNPQAIKLIWRSCDRTSWSILIIKLIWRSCDRTSWSILIIKLIWRSCDRTSW